MVVLPFTNLGGLHDYTRKPSLPEDPDHPCRSLLRLAFAGAWPAQFSAFTYNGNSIDLRQVGQDLGVGYAVEGSARRNGDVMCVTVR